MRKFFRLRLRIWGALFLPLFCLCAGKPAPLPERAEKLRVVATVFPAFDFARAVGGDAVEVTMLLPPGAESHSYEPTPRDILRIRDCDLFICVGGPSEAWVKEVLDAMPDAGITRLSLLDCVEAVEEEIVPGMEAPEEEEAEGGGPAGPEYDEHVWTSPRNAILIVSAMAKTLAKLDPGKAEVYQANAAAYKRELEALDAEFREIVAHGVRKTLVFGDRFPFRYFADAYGLSYAAAFPGCATETEADAATIRYLIDKVRAEKIPVIFHLELSNKKMAEAIAGETGAKVRLFHACHNVTKKEVAAGVTYIDLMRGNEAALREALQEWR